MSLNHAKTFGMVPDKRSGHVAVFYNGKMYVHGGFGEMERDTTMFLDKYYQTDHIWEYDIEMSTWKCITTTNEAPFKGISGSNACVFRDTIVFFAGFEKRKSRISGVYQLDLKDFSWTNLENTNHGNNLQGRKPSERDKFTSWVHGDQIIYFGGYGIQPTEENGSTGEFRPDLDQIHWTSPQRGWNNILCVLDFSKYEGPIEWKYPETVGEKPLPRAAHASTKIGHVGYIFGGRLEIERLNDMHSLDLDTFEWKRVTYNSAAPCGRSWHSFNKLSSTQILLYAGLDTNGTPLADMWIFNVNESTWNEIEGVGSRLGDFATRMWHTAVNTNVDGEVIIFGGCQDLLSPGPSCQCDLVTIFRANPLSLQEQCLEKVIANWKVLKSRKSTLPIEIQRTIHKHLLARTS
eukprot:gene6083-6786_t